MLDDNRKCANMRLHAEMYMDVLMMSWFTSLFLCSILLFFQKANTKFLNNHNAGYNITQQNTMKAGKTVKEQVKT